MSKTTPRLRFRQARERLGLSPKEIAEKTGIPEASIWDIEEHEGDLTDCHSPHDVQKFCRILEISPSELFGRNPSGPAFSPEELSRRITEKLQSRNLSLEQFEDMVGWRLSGCLEPPERLLENITINGLQDLCRELEVDWLCLLSRQEDASPSPITRLPANLEGHPPA